ncbi:hypothetical protein BSL82_02690 [Tardibacter chloracetimidivorans]|uniref:GGDEF-domain containing protein n=2 Tax=Tardibacter chloracetimidivorans TaxID=1921510 RepID=A0A1L3ZZ57_9SPHN|nr:hypothetical protein BSL82_02690 [Tardibacter chloracetimidivorans]
MILNALPLGVVIAQPAADGRWIVAASNQLFDRWSSLEEASALGLPLEMIAFLEQGDFLKLFTRFAEDDGSQVADYRWSVDESPRARHFAIRFVRMADRGRIQITLRDCTTEVETEHGLRNEMLRDALTGLPNRIAFSERLDGPEADGQAMLETAILVADLDRFSRINDSLGHLAGDELLATIARRLLSAMREGDVLARIGGDVFGVIVRLTDGPGDALNVASLIQEALSHPFRVNGRELIVRATIGIATPHADGVSSEELIGNAEFAVTRAKRQGRRVEIYHPADATAARRRFTLETELRQAIERDELTLSYQPMIELKTGRIRAVEALARWNHPERGPISPSEFIPLAEETGLILPLGRWALNTACQQLAEWHRTISAASRIQMSVNVSGIQLARDDVVEAVREALAGSGLPGEHLKIELTESAIIDNPERTKRVLEALKGLDAQIAMDDFGTGYSSLAYLQRLPIDVLKVDHSFVKGMLEEEDSFEIVNAIISLARSLMMDTVAEGIERPEQAARLRTMGCVYGQGYLYARPLSAADFPAYLENC